LRFGESSIVGITIGEGVNIGLRLVLFSKACFGIGLGVNTTSFLVLQLSDGRQ
jgi:hypothetical protein